MNFLICIGCDKYDFLNPLGCAEADAKAVFDILTTAGDPYSTDHAVLLCSPTTEQARQALTQIFPLKSECDSVTFFFAGHGGMAGGSFFLCLSDCQRDKLSTTGLSISSLFTIINEFKPIQVNLVIDACSAGGSSSDLGTLIKTEFTGSSTSSSIAFLGACCVDQNAAESSGHGYLTAQLLRTLRGEVEVQRRAPLLDLLEIGTVVSSIVEAKSADQRPLSWGLSLFGGSRFARNPFYSAQASSQHFPLPEISPYSHFGSKIREKSGELWEIHREIPKDLDPRRLLRCLAGLLSEGQSAQERVALVKGIGASLSARAAESEDLMAPWLCMATCIVSLLPYTNETEVAAHLPELCLGLLDRDGPLQRSIDAFSKKDENYLLSQYAVAGDLYYLPLRITQIFGWLGLDILGRRLLGDQTTSAQPIREQVKELLGRYVQGLSAVSDAQGPPLYTFLLACRLCGWDDLAKEVLTSVYASFSARNGNVTRCNVPVEQAVRYVLSLTNTPLTPKDWRPANPSHLLPVLLVFGSRFGLATDWNLRSLDHVSMNFFIPKDPRDYSMQVIEDGMNYVHQIGAGIWKVGAYVKEYDQELSSAKESALFVISPATRFQCLLSAFLFPDRIPHFIGEGDFAA
jgi:hypothetical protein